MKFIISCFFLLILLTSCRSAKEPQVFYFEEISGSKIKFTNDSLNINFINALDTEKLILFGSISTKNESINEGQRFFIIDKKTKAFTYVSDPYESAYGGKLYKFRINDISHLILWEQLNEYYSYLKLYRITNDSVVFVGELNVIPSSNSDTLEDYSYPVNKIYIQVNGDSIYFTFLSKTKLIVDGIAKESPHPLIFELIQNKLKIK